MVDLLGRTEQATDWSNHPDQQVHLKIKQRKDFQWLDIPSKSIHLGFPETLQYLCTEKTYPNE